MLPSIHFASFPSAPQELGSDDDDDEEELTPAEVVQRMKVCDLSNLYHDVQVWGFELLRGRL